MTDLVSRTALVTGASRGIGRATARALALAGARVIVHYGNSAKDADSLVAEIRKAGGQADSIGADLSAPDGAHKLAAEVGKLVGRKLDVLVANAGIAVPASIEAQTVEDFDRMFAVNVRAPFFLVQQLLPLMDDGSSIVLTSSLAAHAAVGQLPAYSATKGAIGTLVKHFASLLGSPRHSCQRRCAGDYRHRHVGVFQNRRGTQLRPRPASAAVSVMRMTWPTL